MCADITAALHDAEQRVELLEHALRVIRDSYKTSAVLEEFIDQVLDA